MAGEVRSQLTIELKGGLGTAGGGSGAGPVSRQADTLGPMGSMSSFAGARQQRWGRVMAMEMARDREAVRELEEAVLRRQAMAELDLASTRRNQEAFINSIRASRGAQDLLGSRNGQRTTARLQSWSRGSMRGGAAAFGSSIAEAGFGASPGFVGAIGRIGAAAAAGAATGGPVLAMIVALQATVSNLESLMKHEDEELDTLRGRLSKIEDDLREQAEREEVSILEIRRDLEADIRRSRDSAEFNADRSRYREQRFENLTRSTN